MLEVKHLLLWLPMILIAFANATLRELIFIKHYSELRAHQLSTITLILFCAIYSWFIFPALNIQHVKQSLLIGLVWVLLTVSFELLLGRMTNKSRTYLFQDYDIFTGHIWLVFIVCLFLLPYVVYVIRCK